MSGGMTSTRCRRYPWIVLAAALALLAPLTASAQSSSPAPLRVLASTGLKAVLEDVHGKTEEAIGRPVAIQFGASRALKNVIDSGLAFDVAIVTPEVLDAEIGSGRIAQAGRRDLARTLVALAQRGGRPGDIATPAGLKTTLLGAKSIRYNPIGSGRPTIDRMLTELGVQAGLAARTQPLPSAKNPPAALEAGEYELSIILESEVADLAPGAANLGPIPAPFQVPVVMTAGVGAKGDEKGAKALIEFLRGPTVARVLTAHRMTPLGGQP
jgi:molybdate transport system substrate-binding protein